jgi:uncharacterized protein (DUF1015 family)
VTKTQSFTGIIAGTSVADYCNIIKKHEDIIAFRVDYKDYMKYSRFNTEPV